MTVHHVIISQTMKYRMALILRIVLILRRYLVMGKESPPHESA